ncbi:MAG: HNH endonuclease, partial [Verrucomicrobiales bacterium]|nr:HNH endonuclease [Verrucomicrobiales bacterium]
MRPIDRGEAPGEFEEYGDAKEDLVARLGLYCSYCERPILTNLAVEHVRPKSLYPELELSWDNFVLGCVNCNSTKLNRDVVRNDFILPDQDNAFRAYVYTQEGAILISEDLTEEVQEKAGKTLWLTGLNKFPDEFEGEEF